MPARCAFSNSWYVVCSQHLSLDSRVGRRTWCEWCGGSSPARSSSDWSTSPPVQQPARGNGLASAAQQLHQFSCWQTPRHRFISKYLLRSTPAVLLACSLPHRFTTALVQSTMTNTAKNQIELVEASKGDPALADHDRELQQALKDYVPGTEEEKKLLRKIDLSLMPCLWIM